MALVVGSIVQLYHEVVVEDRLIRLWLYLKENIFGKLGKMISAFHENCKKKAFLRGHLLNFLFTFNEVLSHFDVMQSHGKILFASVPNHSSHFFFSHFLPKKKI